MREDGFMRDGDITVNGEEWSMNGVCMLLSEYIS